MRAEAAGDPGPWRQQTVLGRGRWDADALRDLARDYVLETLADPDAVLVIDETGFLKQGKASCGVARQYTGSAGKVTNCQIGVFAAYVSCHGHAFIDRALYLPKAWTDDPQRLAAAHVPAGIGFSTKPQLAGEMIGRALAARTPFAWVAGDSVYGVGAIEAALRRAGKGYVLGVTGKHHVRSWGKEPVSGTADEVAATLDASAWARLSAGDGTKGARLHDWAYIELADLDAATSTRGPTGPGPGGCWSDATSPMGTGRSSPPGVLPAPGSTLSSRSKDVAGRSRTASRPPRTSSGSITMKPAPGMAGIATSRSSCWR